MALSRTTLFTEGANNQGNYTTTNSAILATDDLLVVLITQSKFSNADQPTAVTWNSIGLTKAVGIEGPPGGPPEWHAVSIWYLKVTSGATATISITGGSTGTDISVVALKYTGYDTATPIGDTDSSFQTNSSGIPPSLTLTTANGDEVLDCVASEGSLTIGAGQTSLYSRSTDDPWNHAFSVEAATGASVTMSWTTGLDRGYDHCAVVIKAASGGGGGPFPHHTRRALAGGMSFPRGGLLAPAKAAPIVARRTLIQMPRRQLLRPSAADVRRLAA